MCAKSCRVDEPGQVWSDRAAFDDRTGDAETRCKDLIVWDGQKLIDNRFEARVPLARKTMLAVQRQGAAGRVEQAEVCLCATNITGKNHGELESLKQT